jgi:lipopolysaccharide biosynthesis regulator YciM
MNLGQFLLLVVILAAVAAFIGVPWWLSRRREVDRWDPKGAYLAVIDALIRGHRLKAAPPLRELAQHEAENLGAYIRLGDLVRGIGHPDRAYKIHVDLLAREIDDPDDLRRVHESLLQDLLLLDRPEELKRSAEKLLALDRRNQTALRALVRYHERSGQWEQALELLDSWEEAEPGEAYPTPVQMRIAVARTYMESERPREARRLLDEAVRMPGHGPMARVFLGDLHAREGDLEKASEQWIEYVKAYGHRSEQVFARLERAYFEMGRFGDLIQVYEGLAAGGSGNVHAAVALADMHRRRGRLDEAIRQLQAVLEAEPTHQAARRQLVDNLFRIGSSEQAMRELDILLDAVMEPSTGTKCGSCGETNEDLWVRCDHCGAWQKLPVAAPPPRPRPVPVPHAD